MTSRYPIQFRRLQERFPFPLTDFRGFGGHTLGWGVYCRVRTTLADLGGELLMAPKSDIDELASANPKCVEGLTLLSVADDIAVYRDELAAPRAYIERGATRIPMTVADKSPRKVIVEVSNGPGRLVLNDLFFPGWRAFIDGSPVPIERVNGLSRGVHVPAAEGVVTFIYAPTLLPWIGIAGLGVLGSLCLAFAARRFT
jgi:hypothetical protein